MKKPIKKWACNYKNLQRLGEALCGSLPKMLPKPKSLSSVDHITASCWDAVMRTFTFTAVPLFTRATLGHRPPRTSLR